MSLNCYENEMREKWKYLKKTAREEHDFAIVC